MKDTSQIKEKIIQTLRIKGPTIPVRISKEIDQTPLFTSAFLSELLSEKKLKTSNLRVGSSPVYFLSGQEFQLENFSEHLKSKEKEAFQLIKEKQFLKDSELEPAIRVAMREIKDFAIPFEKDNQLYWKYLTAKESNFENKKSEIKKDKSEIPKSIIQDIQKQQDEDLNIFEKENE